MQIHSYDTVHNKCVQQNTIVFVHWKAILKKLAQILFHVKNKTCQFMSSPRLIDALHSEVLICSEISVICRFMARL